MQVRMLLDAMGASGPLLRGQIYSVADPLALELIGTRRAEAVDAAVQTPTPVGLSPAEAAAVRSMALDSSTLRVNDVSAGRANADAINAALATGRPVQITAPGEIYLAKPIRLPSHADLRVVAPALPKLVANAKCAAYTNRDAQNALPVSAMTIAGGTVTLLEKGHDKAIGQTVYIEGCLTNTALNGPKLVTAATDDTWSYAGSGSLPTNTNEQRIMVSVYNPLAGSNFTRASNVVTVADAGHRRQQGDHVYIAGLGGASTFNGKAKILAVVPGVSWTYANTGANETATGTANVLGNTGIRLDIRYDGNRSNQSALDEWLDFPCQFVNVGNMYIEAPAVSNFWWRGLGFWNAGEIDVPICRFYRGSVGIQFDSACDGVRIGTALGREMSDDVVAWGVTAQTGQFGETACPSGPGNMGSLAVQEIDGDSPTGLFKFYCATGYDLGDMKIGTLRGTGRGVASDSGAGVSGGTAQRLHIESFLAEPGTAGYIGLNIAGLASLGALIVDNAVDNYSSLTNTFFMRFAVASLGLLRIPSIVSLTYTAGTYSAFQVESGCVIDDVQLCGGKLSAGTNAAGTAAFNCAAGGRVKCLTLENMDLFGAGAYNSGTYAGRIVREESTGRIDRLLLRNVRLAGGQLDAAFMLGGSGHTQLEIHGVTQGLSDDTLLGKPGSVFNDGSGATKSITAIISGLHIRDVANRVFQYAGGGTHRIRGSGIVPLTAAPYRFALLTSGTHSTSIDCPEAWIDLGASAGSPPARLVPQAGDRVYNANATGQGHYVRTAAGAWQLLA